MYTSNEMDSAGWLSQWFSRIWIILQYEIHLPEYRWSSTDIVTSSAKASSTLLVFSVSVVLLALLIFWYSTTKLVIGHPPSNQALKFNTIELELTLISWVVVAGEIGADPIVCADTVSVLSPTPKSFVAWKNVAQLRYSNSTKFHATVSHMMQSENNHTWI